MMGWLFDTSRDPQPFQETCIYPENHGEVRRQAER